MLLCFHFDVTSDDVEYRYVVFVSGGFSQDVRADDSSLQLSENQMIAR